MRDVKSQSLRKSGQFRSENQRIIKFRAWDGVEMHYNVVPLFGTKDEDPVIIEAHAMGICRIKPVKALLEYTGLHDKNGKEIYEGDIVKSKLTMPGKTIYIVKWEDETAEFFIQNKDVCKDYVEIIGNVYENSELVETKPTG